MERDSMVMYRSFVDAVLKLEKQFDAKTAMELFKAITKYGLDGKVPDETSAIIDIILTPIIPQIDANTKRFENGKKGGRPKKEKVETDEKTEKPMVSEEKTSGLESKNHRLSSEKPNVNDNVNVNGNENDNVNVISLEEKNKKFFDSLDFRKQSLKKIRNSTEIYESFVDWINYKRIDCGDITKVKATLNMFSALCTEGYTTSNIIQSTSSAIIDGHPKILCVKTDKIEKKHTERLSDFL